jgi:MFS family permease
MGGSVWTSWMADMVPHDIRGRFFAWRNRYFSICQVTAGIASGYVMQHYAGPHPPWVSYMALYVVAAVIRFFSGLALWAQYEPPLNFMPTPRDFTYVEFLSKAPTSNFARFTIFVALVHGTTAIAGPFFNVYFLKELHIPHATFAMIVNGNLIGTLLFLPFWGKVGDRHGNWFVTRVTAFGIAALPLPYLFLTSPTWLWILNFAAGALWCGFGLATFNYLLEAVTPQRRVRCAAYMAATVGFAVFIFGLFGGWLATVLPPLLFWPSGYQTLFAVSALLRFAAVGVIVGFDLIREIRNVKPVDPSEVLAEFPGVRLTLDFARNAYRLFRRI